MEISRPREALLVDSESSTGGSRLAGHCWTRLRCNSRADGYCSCYLTSNWFSEGQGGSMGRVARSETGWQGSGTAGQRLRRLRPPSTWMTSPVEKGKAPEAMAATARPTSSGVPQRRIGERPAAILSRIGIVDGPGHVGLDQPGTDLVDADPLLRQPDCEELGDHAQPGLGDAVFRAVHAGKRAGDRRDEDDLGLALTSSDP